MKKKVLMASAIIAVAVACTGCKSNQKSMQSLYEQAKEQETAAAVEEVAPVSTVARPVSTPTVKSHDRTERVSTLNSSDAALLKDYNVIVGSFGQLTNAEATKSKFSGRGYNSFIVRNEAGMYRVVAGGYDTRDAAESVRDAIRNTDVKDAWLLIPQR
jgi:cell division protein FtsN